MRRASLRTVGLSIAMLALHGCKEHHGKQAIARFVQGNRNACFADLPHQAPIAAAVAAYKRGDHRLLIYKQYGEGNYPVAPLSVGYEADTGRPWQAGWARVVSMSRDRSQPLQCVDCDYPPDACGLRKQEWLRLYNSEVCRRASASGLRHCAVKYVQP